MNQLKERCQNNDPGGHFLHPSLNMFTHISKHIDTGSGWKSACISLKFHHDFTHPVWSPIHPSVHLRIQVNQKYIYFLRGRLLNKIHNAQVNLSSFFLVSQIESHCVYSLLAHLSYFVSTFTYVAVVHQVMQLHRTIGHAYTICFFLWIIKRHGSLPPFGKF